MSVDYEGLIHKAIHQFHAFSADANNSSSKRKESQQASDMDALDFEKETPKDEDRYLAGNFEPDTWVGKLESDEEGEQGSYNVAVSLQLIAIECSMYLTRPSAYSSIPLHEHRTLCLCPPRTITLNPHLFDQLILFMLIVCFLLSKTL